MTLFRDIITSIYRHDYGSIWEQFAREKNGTYLKKNGHRVQYTFKDFGITLNSYTHYTMVGNNSYERTYTRAKVEFTSSYHYSLRITQQGFFEKISKIFGTQDIQIGHRDFDKKFFVKSADKKQTKLIFSNLSIVKLLLEMKSLRLEITDGEGLWSEKPSEGHFMIYFVLDETIKNLDQLQKLSNLFQCLIDTLLKVISIKPAQLKN